MLNSLDKTIAGVFQITWPMIFISVVLISSVRIMYLLKHKEEFVFYKEILHLIFMIYILCLFQVVTVGDTSYVKDSNFVPFKEIMRYNFGNRLFVKNIVGNVLMFIPYGFFASLYGDIKKPLHALGIILLASISIECTQMVIGRIFDIDDILLNVSGGMVGFLIYISLDKISNLAPNVFKSKIFLNITTVVILCLMMLYIVWRF